MPTKPLALGVCAAGDLSLSERRQRRLSVAARAHTEGYTLLETFEVGVNGIRDADAAGGLVSLTGQHDVEAILVCGAVDVEGLQQLDLDGDPRIETL